MPAQFGAFPPVARDVTALQGDGLSRIVGGSWAGEGQSCAWSHTQSEEAVGLTDSPAFPVPAQNRGLWVRQASASAVHS